MGKLHETTKEKLAILAGIYTLNCALQETSNTTWEVPGTTGLTKVALLHITGTILMETVPRGG